MKDWWGPVAIPWIASQFKKKKLDSNNLNWKWRSYLIASMQIKRITLFGLRPYAIKAWIKEEDTMVLEKIIILSFRAIKTVFLEFKKWTRNLWENFGIGFFARKVRKCFLLPWRPGNTASTLHRQHYQISLQMWLLGSRAQALPKFVGHIVTTRERQLQAHSRNTAIISIRPLKWSFLQMKFQKTLAAVQKEILEIGFHCLPTTLGFTQNW